MTSEQHLHVLSLLIQFAATAFVLFTFNKLSRGLIVTLESQRAEFCSLLKHSIDTIKAKSLAERTLAEAEEKRNDVQIEMLKDAMIEERESGAIIDPVYARTDAGTEINIREYDIL